MDGRRVPGSWLEVVGIAGRPGGVPDVLALGKRYNRAPSLKEPITA